MLDAATYGYYGHERTPRIRLADQLGGVLQMADPATLSPEMIGLALSDLSGMGVAPVEVDCPRRRHGGAAVSARL